MFDQKIIRSAWLRHFGPICAAIVLVALCMTGFGQEPLHGAGAGPLSLAEQLFSVNCYEGGYRIDLFCRVAKSLHDGPAELRADRVRAFVQEYVEVGRREVQKLQDPDRTDRTKTSAMNIAVLCQFLFKVHRPARFGEPSILNRKLTLSQIEMAETATQPGQPPQGKTIRVSIPIVFYKGMPIYLVTGYSGGGRPENAVKYLEECIAKCEWAESVYDASDVDRTRSLVEEFISLHARSLESREKNFLRQQSLR